MDRYKIFVTSRPGATFEQDLILGCDIMAVRHGQRMAAPGERLEVWRGDKLIFRSEALGTVPRAPTKSASMH